MIKTIKWKFKDTGPNFESLEARLETEISRWRRVLGISESVPVEYLSGNPDNQSKEQKETSTNVRPNITDDTNSNGDDTNDQPEAVSKTTKRNRRRPKTS